MKKFAVSHDPFFADAKDNAADFSSFPPEVKSFDEYVERICDNFVSVTNSRIEELRGNALLVIEAPFVSHLTNSYYGGSKFSRCFHSKVNLQLPSKE